MSLDILIEVFRLREAADMKLRRKIVKMSIITEWKRLIPLRKEIHGKEAKYDKLIAFSKGIYSRVLIWNPQLIFNFELLVL